MKKLAILLCLAVLAAGCATFTAAKFTSQNRENLSRLYVGMPRATALKVMGQKPVSLCCSKKPKKEIMVANPYRTETIQVADRNFEVVYYAVNITDDCMVDEASLMPLVFENKKLAGWGQNYLDGLTRTQVIQAPVVLPAGVREKPDAVQKNLK